MGATLTLVDRDPLLLESLAEELWGSWKTETKVVPTNLEDEFERNELIKSCMSDGAVDILINNAAFVGSSELDGWSVPFEEQAIDAWRRAIEVNLTSVFHLSRDLAKLLSKSETGGCIINIASIYGEFGPDWSLYSGTQMSNPAAYGASKAGMIQLTKWLATTLAPSVRVNAISPGGIFRVSLQSLYIDMSKKLLLKEWLLNRTSVELQYFLQVVCLIISPERTSEFQADGAFHDLALDGAAIVQSVSNTSVAIYVEL